MGGPDGCEMVACTLHYILNTFLTPLIPHIEYNSNYVIYF